LLLIKVKTSMTDKTILYIAATIVLLHIVIGFGWVLWKIRKKKP